MRNWFNRNLMTIYALPFYLLTLLFCAPLYAADDTAKSDDNDLIKKQISLLEENFKKVSAEFYQASSQQNDGHLKTYDDIGLLQTEINRLLKNNQSTSAIQLLYLNADTLTANFEDEAIFSFTELLLKKNEWNLANELRNKIKEEGDLSLLATMQFIFAKYHAARFEWQQVNTLLSGITEQLSAENAEYAYLLNGSALQHLKQHRQAKQSYNRIPISSPYYAYAQLNAAIADIRQGWWTDAQSTINSLITHVENEKNDELANRLYLVLGYTLLQNDYFRDARNAFRHVGLDSRYTNRALLGIGLTATNQGDYVGGLNALTILKDKKTFDLPVDEAYLIVPYVYEKLQQQLTVTASYSEAMTYFQQRINSLEKIVKADVNIETVRYDDNTGGVIIEGNSLDYGRDYPESIIKNYRILKEYLTLTNNAKIKHKLEALLTKHHAIFQLILDHLLNQRITFLKSYLNQSRYGLARLYDKSNEDAE